MVLGFRVSTGLLLMIQIPSITLRTPNYGKYGIFLVRVLQDLISSTIWVVLQN